MAKESELDQFVRRLGKWRRSRARLGPLPAEIWAEAGLVAGKFGIGATARAAGLNYARVKAATKEAKTKGNGKAATLSATQQPRTSATAFVQLRPITAGNAFSPHVAPSVEFCNVAGDRMRVSQATVEGTADLLRVFLGRQA